MEIERRGGDVSEVTLPLARSGDPRNGTVRIG
jgi:hypothetical protein